MIERIRAFWDGFAYDDVGVASAPAGTAAWYDELEAIRFRRLDYLPRVVEFDAYRGRRVLEIGCRIGLDLARFAAGGARVTGIELAPSCIDGARRLFELRGLEGDLRVMDGERLAFDDGSFDLVYVFGVLPYTADPGRMLAEVRRVLVDGGEAIVMVYNRSSWLSVLSRLSGKNLMHEEAPVYRSYSAGSLRGALERAGLREVSIRTERFPVRTGLHAGVAARLFYGTVGALRRLPPRMVRPLGAHLLARAVR